MPGSQFGMNTIAARIFHDHHNLDRHASGGRRLRRLPDRTLVWAEDYDRELAAYHRRRNQVTDREQSHAEHG